MTSASYIFLAGASRGVGREIAKYLTKQQLKIKALLRTAAVAAELEAVGIQVVQGDALNVGDVERAMLADEPIHAVISTIGGLPTDGVRPDFLGNKNLIEAAVNAGVQKFILVSSIGTGNSAVALPDQALKTLGPVLAEKQKAEQHLIASGLTYTHPSWWTKVRSSNGHWSFNRRSAYCWQHQSRRCRAVGLSVFKF